MKAPYISAGPSTTYYAHHFGSSSLKYIFNFLRRLLG